MVSAHEFALYWNELGRQSFVEGSFITCSDKDLIHRIVTILRMRVGSSFSLFSRGISIDVKLQKIGKKELCFFISRKTIHSLLSPHVTWFLPLLEKNDLENGVEYLTVMGASAIQLIITQKSRQSFHGLHEFDRLNRIIIAAAEQSKNFVFPILLHPLLFAEALKSSKNISLLFADPLGTQSYEVFDTLKESPASSLFCVVGPEGDLVQHEKSLLKEYGAVFVALTPTVLRSCHAACLMQGMIRSFCS